MSCGPFRRRRVGAETLNAAQQTSRAVGCGPQAGTGSPARRRHRVVASPGCAASDSDTLGLDGPFRVARMRSSQPPVPSPVRPCSPLVTTAAVCWGGLVRLASRYHHTRDAAHLSRGRPGPWARPAGCRGVPLRQQVRCGCLSRRPARRRSAAHRPSEPAILVQWKGGGAVGQEASGGRWSKERRWLVCHGRLGPWGAPGAPAAAHLVAARPRGVVAMRLVTVPSRRGHRRRLAAARTRPRWM